MDGLYFDFENNDIVMGDDGAFKTANIDAQVCAFIATSQVCRLTKPEVGETLAANIINSKGTTSNRDIARAKSAVEKDGGTNVEILLNEAGQLSFNAEYDS